MSSNAITLSQVYLKVLRKTKNSFTGLNIIKNVFSLLMSNPTEYKLCALMVEFMPWNN